VEEAARISKIDARLLHAVIAAESAYNPHAQSNKGAVGMMQLMPATARRYGVTDSRDARQNIGAGARYLADLLQLFHNDISLALAAYNAGENAVLRYGSKVPPYAETLAYVPRVLGIYNGFASASL
jgi:soluble lytic murein transglycosylase-like protein